MKPIVWIKIMRFAGHYTVVMDDVMETLTSHMTLSCRGSSSTFTKSSSSDF